MPPLITKIEGCSFDDGPGIRSVIFLKGCPLNCLWCHNPESKLASAELSYDIDECIGCKSCIKGCPQKAISIENKYFIDREKCRLSFSCVEVCPATALRRVGREMTVGEIVKEVLRYKPFYDNSGGGVTLSGGEPTHDIEFASKVLKRFKSKGINTLIETCGLFDLEAFESLILPFIDSIYFDIKLIDIGKHEKYCGIDNWVIITNFITLHELSERQDFELVPRTPLIPNFTDTEDNINALVNFYSEHKITRAVLLPNNPAWTSKLKGLGRKDSFNKNDPIRNLYDEEKKTRISREFKKSGIDITFG